MKNKSLVTILLLSFYTINMFGMQGEPTLIPTLGQLTNKLDELEKTLKKEITYEKVEKGVQKTLQHIDNNSFDTLEPELKQIVLLEMIPASIKTPEQFIEIVQKITSLAETNKANYALLSDPHTMQKIIERLFKSLSAKILRDAMTQIKNNRIRVLPIIGNALLLSQETSSKLTKPKKEQMRQVIQTIVEKGLSPNTFIGENNLFHWAIYWDMPELVQFLIDRGADINMPNRKEPTQVFGELFDKTEPPFIIAFESSLSSALILLQQKNIDKALSW